MGIKREEIITTPCLGECYLIKQDDNKLPVRTQPHIFKQFTLRGKEEAKVKITRLR